MFPVLKYIQKIPAGTMIVPLFIAAFINTFFPALLKMGGYTQALFSSDATDTMLALMMLLTGTQMNFKDLIMALRQGGLYVLVKCLFGIGFYTLVMSFFGHQGVFGVCSLAILCAMTNCNGSMYMGLVATYGDQRDMGARAMFNINSGPTLTLLALGVTGNENLDAIEFLSLLLPLFIGMILGNIDYHIKEATVSGTNLILPLLGFVLGASIDLYSVFEAGLTGLYLYVLVLIITGPVSIWLDHIVLKKPGYAAMSTISVAGNAIAVPAVIGQVDTTFAPYVHLAMVQISGAVIFSAIFTPILTHMVAKKYGCPQWNQVFKS